MGSSIFLGISVKYIGTMILQITYCDTEGMYLSDLEIRIQENCMEDKF